MTTYTFGNIIKDEKAIEIIGSDGSVERAKLTEAADRIKELRAAAAAPLFTAGQVASCYKKQNRVHQ